jgi:hypothetical protein
MVGLEVGSEHVTVAYDLDLPTDHPFVQQLAEGAIDTAFERDVLMKRAMGTIDLKALTPSKVRPADALVGFTFEEPTVDFVEGGRRAHLRLASAPAELPAGQYELQFAPPEDRSVTVGQVRVHSSDFRIHLLPTPIGRLAWEYRMWWLSRSSTTRCI